MTDTNDTNGTPEPTEARVSIGGKEYDLPPLKFKALKAIWNRLRVIFEVQQGRVDPLDAMDAMIAIVAAALAKSEPEMTIERIEEELEPRELSGLTPAVHALLAISGIKLAPETGEVVPVGDQAAASPETSASSSAS